MQLSNGSVVFNLVGLGDKAVTESRERVRAALTSSGLALPAKRITVIATGFQSGSKGYVREDKKEVVLQVEEPKKQEETEATPLYTSRRHSRHCGIAAFRMETPGAVIVAAGTTCNHPLN